MDDREELSERVNIKKAKMQCQQELEDYLEEQKLNDTFDEMMTALIKDKPNDPIQFLIDKLQKPESKYRLQFSDF
jgi:hypothetical protein